MREISSAALAVLNNTNPKFFLLAEIEFTSVMRLTSTSFDLVYKGETYSSLHSLVSFGPPRVSSSVDREIYELSFLDHDNFFQTKLREGINGTPLTVYAGFFDVLGFPLTGDSDLFIAYKGYIDTGKILNDGNYKQVIISAASPMASLDAIGGYIVSKDGMDQVSLVDTSFDDVYVGGKTINLKWGKA
jgi:hypothetical protein